MLFSIIVPIYNAEKYLQQCVESVLNQTVRDFELILVDDGSTDRSGQLVDDYAEQDSRVVAIRKENGGVGSARKVGSQNAKGEYVILLDSDDWLAPNCLEKIAGVLQDETIDMVCFGSFWTRKEQMIETPLVESAQCLDKEMIEIEILPRLITGGKGNLITPTLWGKVFRRETYQKFQKMVDSRITMGEDGAVVYPCVCEVRSICFLPECLYYYRINPTSLTRTKKKQIPWEGALLRIQHYKQQLPLDKYQMEQQLGCYAAHAVFNVLLTQMQHRKYAEVTKEARKMLRKHDLIPLIKKAGMIGSRPERLAQLVIRNQWYLLIKLYALLK